MRRATGGKTVGRLLGTAACVMLVVLAIGMPGAGATEPGHAIYHGTDIDLSVSWEGATVCAVVTATDVRCYDSQAEADADLATISGARSTGDTVDTACGGNTSNWVYLYADANYGGRTLQFQDVGVWQDLATWGFDNQMSSWRNTTSCTATVSWNAGGGGSLLSLSAGSSSSYVGATWNDQASSLYIG